MKTIKGEDIKEVQTLAILSYYPKLWHLLHPFLTTNPTGKVSKLFFIAKGSLAMKQILDTFPDGLVVKIKFCIVW